MATKTTVTTPFTSTANVTSDDYNMTTTAVTKAWNTNQAFLETVFKAVQVVSILEAILILSSNLVLLLIIVTSSSMRQQLRYHLVLSLVCANFIVGIFSAPFNVEFTVRRIWDHGCYFAVIRTLLTFFVQNFVSMWGVILLLLDYLARLLQYQGPGWLVRLPNWLRKAVPGLLVASPWVAVVLIQIPLMFIGLSKVWALWTETVCPLILHEWVVYLLHITCYFAPALILIVLVIYLLVRTRGSTVIDRVHSTEMGKTLGSARKVEMEGTAVHIVVAVLTVLLMGPEHVYFGTGVHAQLPWQESVTFAVAALLLSELLPFIMVVVWILMLPEVRGRVVELAVYVPCCAEWCQGRMAPPESSGATSIAPVTFRNLHDEHE